MLYVTSCNLLLYIKKNTPTGLFSVFLDNCCLSEQEAEKGEINAIFSCEHLENAGCLKIERLKINIKDS